MKVKSESEVAQSCPTLRNPMDCSTPSSFIHRIFQARVLEWGAMAFSASDLPQESNRDCVIFFFLRRTKVKTQTHQECPIRSSHWMVLTKFTLLLSNHAHRYPSQQVEALGIPKHCLIQKLIIFNSGGHYMKNIFKIKFCRLPRQKMSL